MSVSHESMEMSKSVKPAEGAPELEYAAVRSDSLGMFGAAIGGAVLGMLLTLLILAIINGGTLSFSGGERLAVFEANLQRINENVGAVNTNVEIVADQLRVVDQQFTELEAALAAQDQEMADVNEALVVLDTTRQQFNLFASAMVEAFSAFDQAGDAASGAAAAAPAPAESAPEAAAPAAPADSVSVIAFVDANGNGVMDEGESQVSGVAVQLTDAEGNVIAEGTTSDMGAMMEGVEPGDYQVSLIDSAGYTLQAQEGGISVQKDDEGSVQVFVPLSE